MKYKTLINLLYLWLDTENQMQKSGDFSFPSLLAIETLQHHFISEILISVLGETSTLKRRLPSVEGSSRYAQQ
jgi:hypothetical protein